MLLFFLVFGVLFAPKPVEAAPSATWSSGSVTSLAGNGTKENPFLISSEEELAFFAKKVNAADPTYATAYVRLMSDLDLSSALWMPIGRKMDGASSNAPFAGDFDGNGHVIDGLYVATSASCAGLFGYTNDKANIHSFSLVAKDVSSTAMTAYAGAVVGVNNGKLSSVLVRL